METDMILFEEDDLVHPIGPDRKPQEVGIILTLSYLNGTALIIWQRERIWKRESKPELWPLTNLILVNLPIGKGIAHGM